MKFEEGNIYFNTIYIIQSLTVKDHKTGSDLLNDIILRRIGKEESAEIKDVESSSELFQHLEYIEDKVHKGFIPFIHFETHGYKEGIELANGDSVSWHELVPLLLKINTKIKNNLFISLAACKGGNVQFAVKITEPAPFRGFIGPMEDVKGMDLLNSYQEFFDSLLQENDFEKAISSLNSHAKGVKYHYMSTETLFEAVLKHHSDWEQNDPLLVKDRVDYLVEKELQRSSNILQKFGTIENLRVWTEEFVKREKRGVIQSLRDRFFHKA